MTARRLNAEDALDGVANEPLARYHRGGFVTGPLLRFGEIPCQLGVSEIQLVAGEDLKIGDLVTIDRATGKVRRAEIGEFDRVFRIPSEATFEGNVMNIPAQTLR